MALCPYKTNVECPYDEIFTRERARIDIDIDFNKKHEDLCKLCLQGITIKNLEDLNDKLNDVKDKLDDIHEEIKNV